MKLIEVMDRFKVEGSVTQILEYGHGLINDTYRVSTDARGHPGYLLQRINHRVFKDIDGLVDNILRVTKHLNAQSGDEAWDLHLIETKEGSCYLSAENGCWRVYRFIKGGQSFRQFQNEGHAREAGKAFGNFLRALSDVRVNELTVTIPEFHNIEFRLQRLNGALGGAEEERVAAAEEHIEMVGRMSGSMVSLYRDAAGGRQPLRVTHNDTKLNNLLFDREGRARTVIDLDTVMPGFTFYDAGDGVRTGAFLNAEDEGDPEKISFNMDYCVAYLSGYVEGTSGILTRAERDVLPRAGAYMAFIMGVRFLTDYLEGDIYFRTVYPGQNLMRARCQLHAAGMLMDREAGIRERLSTPGQ